VLVYQRDRVGCDDALVSAREGESMCDVLGDVAACRVLYGKAVMNARVEGAIAPSFELALELGQTDQDKRQERPAVPLVVEQDVQMVEHVLVEKVRFIEQENRVDALAPELLDVRADRVEDACRGGGGRQSERLAELTIEVAPAERSVMTVRQTEDLGRQSSSKRSQYAGLAHTGFAGEQDGRVRLDRIGEVVDEFDLGGG
jgi:hypothetical protein